jgi:ABC-2 type transport system permease protein
MPIFDQGYQHWDGRLSGHAWRWLTVTRQGVRAQMKSRLTRIVLLFALLPALGLALALIAWGLLEQKADFIRPIFAFLNFPREIMEGPRAFRQPMWNIAFHIFFAVEMFFSMILVMLVGPGLISQDLRFNAMPLYFSRPLRRFDYFMGKLGVIGFFLGMVAIVPAVFAYVLGVLFSLDLSVFRDTWRLLAASIAYGFVIVLSAGTLMLALSSLSRNSRYVGLFWVGIWIISGVVGGILGTMHEESARHDVFMAEMQMQGRKRDRDQADWMRIREKAAEARTEAARSNWRPLFSYTDNLHRIRAFLFDTHSSFVQVAGVGNRALEAREFADAMVPQYPWYWSAGVLAGLFGISVWILTTRVKSLDRLR